MRGGWWLSKSLPNCDLRRGTGPTLVNEETILGFVLRVLWHPNLKAVGAHTPTNLMLDPSVNILANREPFGHRRNCQSRSRRFGSTVAPSRTGRVV